MRLEQVPKIVQKPSGLLEFKVTSKRHPELNRVFQHPGFVEIKDFLRVAYSINRERSIITLSEKRVDIIDGKEHLTIEFE